MQYEQFMHQVRERAGLSADQAEEATRATLTTLAERITEDEALDLAAQLPQDLKPAVRAADGHGEHVGLEEFVTHVALRSRIEEDEALEVVRAVLATLGEAVSRGEVDDVIAQLPDEFGALFDPPAGGDD